IAKSLKNNRAIYQKNAHQLFMPASSIKILTAIAALSFLGPDYQYHTEALTLNPPNRWGTIDNIYIHFDGDPLLTAEDINNFAQQISSQGIKKISGNIYIDDTIFDNQPLARGWAFDDLNYCCAAPISPIMVGGNCFLVKLTAPEKPNQPSDLTTNINHVSVINKIHYVTNGGKCSTKIGVTNKNQYSLSGCMGHKERTHFPFAINNLRLYIKELLVEQLRNNNIKLKGSIDFKKTPEYGSLNVLAKHQSEPLSEIIKPLLKNSDNSIANMIYKKIGHEYFKKPATWKNSAEAVTNILQSKSKINLDEITLDDGSGVSRYNFVSPDFLVTALTQVYHDQSIRQVFIDALAEPGADGSLKKRMLNLKERIFAKTGGMKGAVSLAGYIKTKTRGMVAFAIIINGFIDKPKNHFEIVDNICTILANS
ncbi:MAG: D-alanyl-D-alanine carboxypeptidase/D-alanyl-D-alanine-endopeptidase, partial [Thiotrichaceae bacterium]|nr:D-alanyl-D-alanine carboxypeptidase/D-alanyl-D-alanine-endopeptidase [Thiotrichaceae bacterium]